MRGRDVGPQRLGAFPGFENDETVRPVVRLERANGHGVDVTGIFDASLFGMHIGDVSAKGFRSFTAAGMGGDDGDDADHCVFLACWSGSPAGGVQTNLTGSASASENGRRA